MMNIPESQFIPINEIVDNEAFDALPKIGFAGPPSAGKGTAADFLSRNYNFAQTTFSTGIRNHLEYAHGILPPYTRDLLKKTGLQMIDAFGPLFNVRNAIKTSMREFAHNPSLQGIVIDGFRWPEEGYAIHQLPNSYIIWIDSDQELRKRRLFERQRPGDANETNFYEVDRDEINWVEPLRKFASATIVNNGDIDSFYSQIQDLVEARFDIKPQV